MNNTLHTNIFFFITSVAVIILTILFVMILVKVIHILKDIEVLSTSIKTEGEEIVSDVKKARLSIKEKAVDIKNIVTMFGDKSSKTVKKKKTLL